MKDEHQDDVTEELIISDTCTTIMIRIIESSDFQIIGRVFSGLGKVVGNVWSLQEFRNWIHGHENPKYGRSNKRKYKKFSNIRENFLEDMVGAIENEAIGDFNDNPNRVTFYLGVLKKLKLKKGNPPGKSDLRQLYYCEKNHVKLITEDYQLCQVGKKILGDDRCFSIYEFLALLEKHGHITDDMVESMKNTFTHIPGESFAIGDYYQAKKSLSAKSGASSP